MTETNPSLTDDQVPFHVHTALLEFADTVEHTAELEDLVRLMVEGRKAAAAIADVNRRAEAEIAKRMSDDTIRIEGLGTLKRHWRAAKETWDGKRVASAIAARCADHNVNYNTGEIMPPAALCQYVAAELTAVGGLDNGSHKWRTGELKARKLDPADYREREGEGRHTIQVLS